VNGRSAPDQCLMLGEEQTSQIQAATTAFDPYETLGPARPAPIAICSLRLVRKPRCMTLQRQAERVGQIAHHSVEARQHQNLD